MSKATIKAEIDANITQNGTGAITGNILNGVLKDMIDATMTAGYKLVGVASLTTDPGTPSENVFYFATEVGEYEYFGLSVAEGEVAIFKFNGTSWSKEVTGIASKNKLSELEEKLLEAQRIIDTEEIIQVSWVEGKYITDDGNVYTGANYHYSDKFDVVEGDVICRDTQMRYVTAYSNGNVVQEKGSSVLMTNYIVPQGVSQLRITKYIEDSEVKITKYKNEYGDKINPNAIGEEQLSIILSEQIGKNLLNPQDEDCKFGYYINSSGVVSANTSYGVTGYIPFTSGYIMCTDRYGNPCRGGAYWQMYDANKRKIAEGRGSMNDMASMVALEWREGVEYIRFSISGGTDALEMGKFQVCNSDAFIGFEPYQSRKMIKPQYLPQHIEKEQRTIVHIRSHFDTYTIIKRMYEAYLNGNCDVIWDFGEYNFNDLPEAASRLYSEIGETHQTEIPLGGNNRYYLNGSKIVCVNQSSVAESGEPICIFGTWRSGGSFELHDANLYGTGIKYCMHDEAQASNIASVRKYYNCHFNYTYAGGSPSSLAKCMGCGTGRYGTTLIDGCTFISSEDINDDLSWHEAQPYSGSMTGIAETSITIKNCYFSTQARVRNNNIGVETINIVYCGNASKRDLVTIGSGDINTIKFCNEIAE